MLLKILSVVVLSTLSGYLYRRGGTKAGTLWRDAVVPLCALTLWCLNTGWVNNVKPILALILTYGLMYASLTTYFKKKGSDAKWWNWLLVGAAFGISALPLAFATHCWFGFTLRTVLLAFGITLWSEKISVDYIEEFGRGFLFTASMLLLL